MDHVVIVGGGFGGLAAAQALAGEPVRVTLVDRRNHHLFQPLLYQVATAGLSPSDVAEPIRSILSRQENVGVRLAHVSRVDLQGRRLLLEDVVDRDPDDGVDERGEPSWLPWDKLILAVGVRHDYFGHPEWEAFAPGLKTLGDALGVRRRVLLAFERAEWAEDPAEREALLTFVVIGAGPTGVELAGALSEIALHTLRRDFRHIDTSKARVLLLEGGPGVLPVYPEALRQSARTQLEQLGVEVRTGALVTAIDPQGVVVGGSERIATHTVLWAAGVTAPAVMRTLGVPTDRAGRVTIGPDLSLPGHPDVFVIGDAAIFEQDGRPLPGLAPVALAMGRHAAANLLADRAGRPRAAFRYRDKGNLATIGRSKAVGVVAGYQVRGLLAWVLWTTVHLAFLVTFRNRLVVFTKWAWAWFTYERAARLIWQGENELGREAAAKADRQVG